MISEKQRDTLLKAYSLLCEVTPRRFDCGTLCGSACCKDLSKGLSPSGMALLPHEKELLSESGFEFGINDDGTDILICNSSCSRELRPFACRIFPYYVKIDGKNVSIGKDPRAAGICPLLLDRRHRRASVYFLRNAKRAVRLLSDEPDFCADLVKTSDFIESLYELSALTS